MIRIYSPTAAQAVCLLAVVSSVLFDFAMGDKTYYCSFGCGKDKHIPKRSRCITKELVRKKTPLGRNDLSNPEGCTFNSIIEPGVNFDNLNIKIDWRYKGKVSIRGFYVKVTSVDTNLLFNIKPPVSARLPRELALHPNEEATYVFKHCAASYITNWIYSAEISTAEDNDFYDQNKCFAQTHIPECCSFVNYTRLQVCKYTSCEDAESASDELQKHFASVNSWKDQLLDILKIVILVAVGLLLIIALMIYRDKKLKSNGKRQVVVLVSSGDKSCQYREIAEELALKLSAIDEGRYEVFFSGWTAGRESKGEAAVRMRRAIDRCAVAVLVGSPFGRKSYGEFVQRKELAVWRDAFVLGSYALMHDVRLPCQSDPTILVAYNAPPDASGIDEHVHDDFKKSATCCFNLAHLSERHKLFQTFDRINK